MHEFINANIPRAFYLISFNDHVKIWSNFFIFIKNIICGFLDPFVGASPFTGNYCVPSTYKGTLYVLQTKPVGAYPNQHIIEEDIEEAWVFDGVWPNSLPYDSFNSDVTSADSIQLSVNFSYDGYPMKSSEGAIEACLEAYTALGHTSLMDTFDNFLLKGARPLSGMPRATSGGLTGGRER